MPRFYFNFRQAGQVTPDETGIEFPSVEAAYLAAADGARGMWAELLARRQDPRLCAFDIRDENGQLLLSFAFNELLESCRLRSRHAQPLDATYKEVQATHRFVTKVRQDLNVQLQAARQSLREVAALLASEI
jgi:hypothetical protein